MTSLSSIVLDNLVSLTIHKVGIKRNTKKVLFPATLLPNLHAVSVRGYAYDYWTRHYTYIEPKDLPTGQLDFQQVHIDDEQVFPSDLFARSTPVLVSFRMAQAGWLSSLSLTRYEHLHLAVDDFKSLHAYIDLERLSIHIKSSTIIKSLSLPARLQNPSNLDAPLLAARQSLLEACAAKKVDIVWCPFANTLEDDRGVSRDFWEYAKELKRKKRNEGERASAYGRR
jgi:hypothetical protein